MFILSQIWLFIMVGVTIVHWLMPPRWRGGWIILATSAFVGYHNWTSLLLLIGLTGLTYFFAARENRVSGKRLIGLIAMSAALIVTFKLRVALSGNAALENANAFEENFLIPLGLSYYTFRCIHYAIEKYKGTIPAHDFYSLAQYLFFLPTMLAGPIHRYPEFSRDLARKRWNPFMMAEGVERILYGYVKISFFANLLVSYLFAAYVQELTDTHEVWGTYLGIICNGLQLYFLFSGYSDVAIGFGLLLGFRVMENFNWPFIAANISDFWQRWHISLVSWCRDYVYMGVISVSRSPALAAASAMLVMGLWHEFSLRYVFWGVYHGVGIIIWQKFQDIKERLPPIENKGLRYAARILSTLLTLHFVFIGFTLVSHDTLGGAFEYLSHLWPSDSGDAMP